MVFDPEESVDLQGQTGPYVQNAYVRIQSVIRKSGQQPDGHFPDNIQLEPLERELLVELRKYPELVQEAAESYDPSIIASYCYDLAKDFHRFYHDHSILNCDSEAIRQFRLNLSFLTGKVLASAMDLLGMEMPERM